MTSECNLTGLQELLDWFYHRNLALIVCHFQSSSRVLHSARSLHFQIVMVGSHCCDIGSAKRSIVRLFWTLGNVEGAGLNGCRSVSAHHIEVLIQQTILRIVQVIVLLKTDIRDWSR